MDDSFARDIKFNCDVSDAKFWGYYSVCGLLMRYRDLYRSEQGLKPWSAIPREEIGAWIEKKESRWPELERREFTSLKIGAVTYDPFDVVAINRALEGQGFVYGAGYGMYMKPSFFLAELRSVRTLSGLTVLTSGRELVRDLFTAPGMLQEHAVFLRLEPLMMLLLFKYSELNVRRVAVLEDAFSHYGFQRRQIIDDTFARRMEQAAERYAEIILAHEIGEAAEDVTAWKDILLLAEGERQVEHYLRAVKDLIADTSDQGPYRKMIDTRDRGALGLSIALMEGYRKALFPEIGAAFSEFMKNRDWTVIERARKKGYERFREIRERIVQVYKAERGSADFLGRIKEQIKNPRQ